MGSPVGSPAGSPSGNILQLSFEGIVPIVNNERPDTQPGNSYVGVTFNADAYVAESAQNLGWLTAVPISRNLLLSNGTLLENDSRLGSAVLVSNSTEIIIELDQAYTDVSFFYASLSQANFYLKNSSGQWVGGAELTSTPQEISQPILRQWNAVYAYAGDIYGLKIVSFGAYEFAIDSVTFGSIDPLPTASPGGGGGGNENEGGNETLPN